MRKINLKMKSLIVAIASTAVANAGREDLFNAAYVYDPDGGGRAGMWADEIGAFNSRGGAQ